MIALVILFMMFVIQVAIVAAIEIAQFLIHRRRGPQPKAPQRRGFDVLIRQNASDQSNSY